MTEVAQRTSPEREWLDQRASERLLRHIDRALARARSGGVPVLVSVTSDVDSEADPTAVVAASRRPGEPWFCLEQPDRDGSAVAAVGSVRALEARGPDRFGQTAKRWRGLAAAAIADEAEGPPGAGLVAVGGFAFAADGGELAALGRVRAGVTGGARGLAGARRRARELTLNRRGRARRHPR